MKKLKTYVQYTGKRDSVEKIRDLLWDFQKVTNVPSIIFSENPFIIALAEKDDKGYVGKRHIVKIEDVVAITKDDKYLFIPYKEFIKSYTKKAI